MTFAFRPGARPAAVLLLLLSSTLTLASPAAQACVSATGTPWPDRVSHAYSQSQAVFEARAVRTETTRAEDGHDVLRVFVQPLRFFKGGPEQAPAFIDKDSQACDQRPVPVSRGKVLVFASAQGELLRTTDEEDVLAGGLYSDTLVQVGKLRKAAVGH